MIKNTNIYDIINKKSNAHKWDIGLHSQINAHPQSSTKAWDKKLKQIIKAK